MIDLIRLWAAIRDEMRAIAREEIAKAARGESTSEGWPVERPPYSIDDPQTDEGEAQPDATTATRKDRG